MYWRISDLVYRKTGRALALAALIVFILFVTLVLPAQTAAGDMKAIPDLKLFYSSGELYRMAEGYGAEGRQAFIRMHFTVDLIWPVVYTLFLITAISRSLDRVLPHASPWRLAHLVPVATMLLDLLENSAVSLVVFRFPETTPVVDSLAGLITLLKWIFVAVSGGILFWGLFRVVKR